MPHQWIVIGDAAQARILARRAAKSSLTRIDTLSHAQSRAHEGDLRTGGKGEVHDQNGAGLHQSDPQTTTAEKHADIFAKQVVERLKAGLNDNAFDDLVIAAAPSFLGRLREHMDNPLNKSVAHTIDKNWMQHDDSRIQKLLDDQLDR